MSDLSQPPDTSSFGFSGATAQTSGFAQSAQTGGLASSPNVPRPGSTINPATGKPHTEGLTRAELAQMKAKGAGLLDSTPQADVARGRGQSEEEAPRERRLSELSGREQAARQLAATMAAAKQQQEMPSQQNVSASKQSGGDASQPMFQGVRDLFEETTSPGTKNTEQTPMQSTVSSGQPGGIVQTAKEYIGAAISSPGSNEHTATQPLRGAADQPAFQGVRDYVEGASSPSGKQEATTQTSTSSSNQETGIIQFAKEYIGGATSSAGNQQTAITQSAGATGQPGGVLQAAKEYLGGASQPARGEQTATQSRPGATDQPLFQGVRDYVEGDATRSNTGQTATQSTGSTNQPAGIVQTAKEYLGGAGTSTGQQPVSTQLSGSTSQPSGVVQAAKEYFAGSSQQTGSQQVAAQSPPTAGQSSGKEQAAGQIPSGSAQSGGIFQFAKDYYEGATSPSKPAQASKPVPRPASPSSGNQGQTGAASQPSANEAAAKQYFGGASQPSQPSQQSGQQQAAKQLVGSASQPTQVPTLRAGFGGGGPMSPGLMTPGLEMPGGWGPVKPVPAPGSAPDAPTSVYTDVAEGLKGVGTAAYAVIPGGLKDVFSNKPGTPQAPGLPQVRRPSAAALFDQAKVQTNKIVHEVQETIQGATTRTRTGSATNEPGVLHQVRGFLGEVIGNTGFIGEPSKVLPKSAAEYFNKPTNEPTKPRSLPPQENQGILPGESSGVAGPLPGRSSEVGVAVLPDQKAAGGLLLPGGEPSGSSAGAAGTTSGAEDSSDRPHPAGPREQPPTENAGHSDLQTLLAMNQATSSTATGTTRSSTTAETTTPSSTVTDNVPMAAGRNMPPDFEKQLLSNPSDSSKDAETPASAPAASNSESIPSTTRAPEPRSLDTPAPQPTTDSRLASDFQNLSLNASTKPSGINSSTSAIDRSEATLEDQDVSPHASAPPTNFATFNRDTDRSGSMAEDQDLSSYAPTSSRNIDTSAGSVDSTRTTEADQTFSSTGVQSRDLDTSAPNRDRNKGNLQRQNVSMIPAAYELGRERSGSESSSSRSSYDVDESGAVYDDQGLSRGAAAPDTLQTTTSEFKNPSVNQRDASQSNRLDTSENLIDRSEATLPNQYLSQERLPSTSMQASSSVPAGAQAPSQSNEFGSATNVDSATLDARETWLSTQTPAVTTSAREDPISSSTFARETPKSADVSSPTSTAPPPPSYVPTSTTSFPATTTTTTVSTLDDDDWVPNAGRSASGMAAALPATFFGRGADYGATDVKSIPGINETKASTVPTTNDSPTASTGLTGRSASSAGPTTSSSFAPTTSSSTSPSASPTSRSAARPDYMGLEGICESTAKTSYSGLSPSPAGAPDTRLSNDRTTSTASVTAIRGGYEGSRPSPLASQPVTAGVADPASDSGVIAGAQRSTTHGPGPEHTTNLTPGKEEDGIGHPSSRGVTGTSREPGSYPTPDHSSTDQSAGNTSGTIGKTVAGTGAAAASSGAGLAGASAGTPTSAASGLGAAGTMEPKSSLTTSSIPTSPNATTTSPVTSGLGNAGAVEPKSSLTTTSTPTTASSASRNPVTPTSPAQRITSPAADSAGHRRTASNVSSDNGGKKKGGFLSKLKHKLAGDD